MIINIHKTDFKLFKSNYLKSVLSLLSPYFPIRAYHDSSTGTWHNITGTPTGLDGSPLRDAGLKINTRKLAKCE